MKTVFNDEMLKLLRRVQVNMPWKFIPRYLEKVLELQINVELGFEAAELDRLSRRDVQAVVDALRRKECRITFHGPFWDLCPGSLDPAIRQVSRLRLHQILDLAAGVRPDQVVCHTGFDPRHHKGHRAFFVEQSLAAWEVLVERAEGLKIPLLLENVWEQDPELHREFFRAIDSPWFGFCLDVGHQHSFSNTVLLDWLEPLSEFLGEVHLHDNDGSRDAHLPVGRGTVSFGTLFSFLKEKNLTPVLTLEPHQEEDLVSSLAGLLQVEGVAEQARRDAFPAGRSIKRLT